MITSKKASTTTRKPSGKIRVPKAPTRQVKAVKIVGESDLQRRVALYKGPKAFSQAQIKKLVTESTLTQLEFAKLVGVTGVTIYHWLKGTKSPRGAALKVLNVARDHGFEVLLAAK